MSNTKETLLDVDGMTCSSCIRHVRGALGALDGIEAVEIEVKGGKVRVLHDAEQATIEEIIAALGDAGYSSRAARA